ncbi:MAG TPA: LuxR C-terminal-related transcriptional regulator, partial [Candidatus Binatia bacterium]|nr:LuxR C-terminal-related transcriptional regulator [Candidatus Binatia bacterium]
FRVARAVGVEWEMELPFAALQQLCAPMLDRLERLPGPQRNALGVAFGLSPGATPDPFLVGLAALSLLSAVGDEQPLLCVVDDAQWLDRASAQALAFVARRLLAERVSLVIATRAPIEELRGLPELGVEGLRNADARTLLASVLRVPLTEAVRERILAESRGNPLALLELPRGLTTAELGSVFGASDAPALSGRIEESLRRRLGELPTDTQRLLLLAAAEPVGDPALLWRAAEQLGIGLQAAAAAESEELLQVAARVTFPHPSVRSAVYRAAAPHERRAVHRALAEATDPELDPDRRAWQRAQATLGPDEDVAFELERSAARAQARGGMAAAAAFLERATAFTLDPALRARRALAAAEAFHHAGLLGTALRLVATAESGPLDEFDRAQVDVLRAQVSFASNRGSDAPPLLLKAARRLEPQDTRLARDCYLDALAAGVFAGRLAKEGSVEEVAEAARAIYRSSRPSRPQDLLLDGLSLVIIEGHAAGATLLRQALAAFRGEDISMEEGLRWLWIACHAAGLLWDYDSWDALSARLVQLARDAGARSALPIGLSTRAGVHIFSGELNMAASLVEEVATVTQATRSSIAPYGALGLAAFRGLETEASELIEAGTREVLRRGEGEGLTFVQWATAVLFNGLGRYEDARAAAEQAGEDSRVVWFSTWGLVELIEAASRTEKIELASDALDRLAETTAASGTDWARGIENRSRALLSDGHAADTFYRQAIGALENTRLGVELARAHLLYGEWLRRERRRLDAREQLRDAHASFSEFGMQAFAERARVELEATGEHALKRTVDARDDLTPQEAQISRLAVDGATNQQIAAQLFISPRTVDYHLRKVFRKLGVKSRTQLARRLL